MSNVYTTIDYKYRHQNKGSGLVLILGKCGVYKLDQKSYKMCTASIDMKYTLKINNAHPHTHRSHQYHVHCYTTIDYEYRHQNKGTGLVLILGKCGVYKFDQKSYKMCTASIDMKYTLK